MDQINLDFQVICDFERDALHRETGRTQGVLHSRFDLDPLGRLLRSQSDRSASQTTQAGQGTEPLSHGQRIARRYQYDAVGQLLSINDQRNGQTRYAYDPLGRLQSAQHGQ